MTEHRGLSVFVLVSGSSDDPCSNTYHGESAASEVETQNMQKGHESLADQIFLAISFHTYGNMWMHPWGWEDDDNNCAHAEDHDDMVSHLLFLDMV